MTTLEYVMEKLNQDFGDYADEISPFMVARLTELYMEYPPSEASEFEELLNDFIFPFLACLHAMVIAGVNHKFANR